MSGVARKRSSKWDLKDDPHVSTTVAQDGVWTGRSGDMLKSKYDMASSYREHLPRTRCHGDYSRDSRDISPWSRDRDLNISISPGLEDTRLQTPSHSPRNDWRKTPRKRSRSRSPSRSRSRSHSWSRSRSPVHKFSRDSRTYDGSRDRAGSSSKICRDFAVGRCRRGSHCHFLHQSNQAYEYTLESRQKEDKAFKYSASRHMGDHHTKSGRSAEICNNFLKGACRRGSSCKYIHSSDSNESAYGFANEMFRESEVNRRNRDVSFERLGEREPHGKSSIPYRYFAAGNCRNEKNCRFSHGHSTVSPDRKARDYDWEGNRSLNNANSVWNGTKQGDTNHGADATMFNESRDKKLSAPVHDASSWSIDQRIIPTVNGESKTFPNSVVSSKTVGGNEVASLKLVSEKGGSTSNVPGPRCVEELPGETAMSPLWNFHVQSSNHFQKDEHKPANGNTVAPQVSSSILPMQDTVSNEQLKQFSASLAQLIANGQQLPQIYASTNSQSSKEMLTFNNTGGPLESVSSLSIHPVPATLSEKQSAPVFSNIDLERSDARNMHAGFPCSIVEQKNSAVADANQVPFDGNSIRFADAPTDNGIYGLRHLESNRRISQLDQPEATANLSTVSKHEGMGAEENKNTLDEENEKDDGQLEDEARDGKAEESKKSKDMKEFRAFKFALVEFVKELMKPAWKEGQIDKENYKTIVKKAVDKVTSTFQGSNVPQTKEKIDHYLSFSKPKITKLVQGYVEKFHKGKTK